MYPLKYFLTHLNICSTVVKSLLKNKKYILINFNTNNLKKNSWSFSWR